MLREVVYKSKKILVDFFIEYDHKNNSEVLINSLELNNVKVEKCIDYKVVLLDCLEVSIIDLIKELETDITDLKLEFEINNL